MRPIPCIRFNKLIRRLKAADGAMVGLVGVQSNQFPRAVDIGRQFRDAGIQVIMGGFHAAGSIAMLPQCPPEIVSAQELGISIYAGEAEGRMDEIVQAAWAGTLKPLYNLMKDLPDLSNATLPILPAKVVRKMAGAYTSFDAGRGCPFQCSFCTIINVQGRKSRHRTPDDVEAIIRTNAAQNINRFFITDDDFARNKDWEGILDRLIWLREEQGFKFKVTLQVDTLCHRLDGFIEKAARGGCARVFIGLENIDPDALAAAKKRQNKIWEYRKMLQAWKDVGVITYAGYILGFPDDTPEKIARNIEIIQREMPLDLIEFFFLTPLPGSEDHKVLHTKGVWMDPDLNKYDLNHRVSHHPIMSDATWEKVYFDSWRQFYTPEHVETVLQARRGARQADQRALFVGGAFPRLDPHREGAPARMRHRPAQDPQAAQAGDEDREPDSVLPAPGGGIAHFRGPLGAAFPQVPSRPEAGQGRQERAGLYRPRHDRVDRRGTGRNGPHSGVQGRHPANPRRAGMCRKARAAAGASLSPRLMPRRIDDDRRLSVDAVFQLPIVAGHLRRLGAGFLHGSRKLVPGERDLFACAFLKIEATAHDQLLPRGTPRDRGANGLRVVGRQHLGMSQGRNANEG